MAAATDCEESLSFDLASTLSSFVILALEDGDSRAELLNVARPDDACWDDFALLLSPVRIHRLLKCSGIVREDDTIGEHRGELFAEICRLW